MAIELISKIKPKNSGSFAMVDAQDVEFEDGLRLPEKLTELSKNGSGIKIVNNLEERDAITGDDLKIGMLCCVLVDPTNNEDMTTYQYKYSGWETFSSGGGISTDIPVIAYTSENPSGEKIYKENGEDIYVSIKFTSSISGKCTIKVFKDNVLMSTTSNDKGIISVNLGKATDGTHVYKISGNDYYGNAAEDVLLFTVVTGGLTLTSTFNDIIDASVITSDTDIIFPYTVNSADTSEDIYIYATLDGTPVDIGIVTNGDNLWSIGKLSQGTHTIEIYSTSGEMTSTTLSYTFSVLAIGEISTISLMSVPSFTTSNRVIVPYRVICSDTSVFITVASLYKVSGSESTLIESYDLSSAFGSGNSWTIGLLEEGEYTYTLQSFTTDRLRSSNIANGSFKVTKSIYSRIEHVADGLIMNFDANTMSNNKSDKEVWRSTVNSSQYAIQLHNLNYSTNGWLNVDDTDEIMLKFTGDSYGELLDLTANTTYKPFNNFDTTYINSGGMTFEVVFRTRCIGEMNTRVVNCQNGYDTSSIGFSVGYDSMVFKSSARQGVLDFEEDEWIDAAFVVNKTIVETDDECANPIQTMRMYINGVCQWVGQITDDQLSNLNPVTFNAVLQNGTVSEFGNCEIKSFRVYNRGLNAEEVLTNYISSIYDNDEQEKEYKANYPEGGGAVLPIVTFKRTGAYKFEALNKITAKTDSKKYYVNGKVTFEPVDSSEEIKVYDNVQIFLQGTSTLAYAMKNYKIKIFKDDTYSKKSKVQIKDTWQPEDTYTLKCDYMEHSHKNNTGIASYTQDLYKTWTDASGKVSPAQVPPSKLFPDEELEFRTTVDGFPVLLYLDDNIDPAVSEKYLLGVYMWNLDKGAKANFGFTKKDENGELFFKNCQSFEITANADTTAGGFNKYVEGMTDAEGNVYEDADEYYRTDFESRYSCINGEEQEDDDVDITALKYIVDWVSEADDDTFYKELEDHFNVQFLIDYYIQVMALGMVDNFGKNCFIQHYGVDKNYERTDDYTKWVWYPVFYDCDSSCGLNNTGNDVVDVNVELPGDDYVVDTTNPNDIRFMQYNTARSKLFTKLRRVFAKEIKQRWSIVRQSHFSYDSLVENLITKMDEQIPRRFVNLDGARKYLLHPNYLSMFHGSRTQKLKKWFRNRLLFLDTLFEYTGENDGTIVIRSNAVGEGYLGIRTYSPCYVTVIPRNGTYITKYVDPNQTYIDPITENTKYGTLFTFVTASNNQDIQINCGGHLMNLNGMNKLIPDFLDIADAHKLVEIDVSGSVVISSLSLAENYYLRTLNCSGCVNLGNTAYDSSAITSLDLSKCTNLKTLNIYNTKIQSIVFPEGGALQTVNLGGSEIRTISLKDLYFLQDLNTDGCDYITSLIINNCSLLKQVELTGSNVEEVRLLSNSGLRVVNLSNDSNIKDLEITNCPEIVDMLFLSNNSSALEDLKIYTQYKLKTLNVSGSSSIKNIRFPMYASEEVATKVAQAIQNGTDYENQSWYKLWGDSLETLTISNSSIKTCQYGSSDETAKFFDCSHLNSLKSISFQNCSMIEDIRNINYSASTLDNMFASCVKLASIRGSLTALNSAQNMFYNCNSLSYIQSSLDLDLSSVTSINSILARASSVVLDDLEYILSCCGSRLVSATSLVFLCTNVKGTLPSTLFANTPNITNLTRAFAGSGISSVSSTLFSNVPKVTTIKEIFRQCKSLTSVPSDVLSPLTAITDATMAFAECTALTSFLSNTSLTYNTALTNLDGFLYNCSNLSVSNITNLFSKLTKLQTARFMFAGCTKLSLSSFPEGLFRNNSSLIDISAMFANCKNLACNLPQRLFRSSSTDTTTISTFRYGRAIFYNTNVKSYVSSDLFAGATGTQGLGAYTTYDINFAGGSAVYVGFGGLFQGTKVTGYYDDFLKTLTSLNNCDSMFRQCTSLIEHYHLNDDGSYSTMKNTISTSLFKYNKYLSVANNLFDGCTSAVGYIPSSLFESCKSLNSISCAFRSCTSLTGMDLDNGTIVGFPTSLLKNKASLTNVSYLFNGCSNYYGSINNDFLEGCTNLQSVAYLFADCSNLQATLGVLYSDFFDSCRDKLVNASYLFYKCSMIDGVIPPNFFKDCNKLTTTERCFSYCQELTGRIPDTLFAITDGKPSFTVLTNTSYMFDNCIGLAHLEDDTDDNDGGYFVNPDLFKNCPSLVNVSGMFNQCQNLDGYLPNNLFQYNGLITNASALFSTCYKLSGSIENTFLASCLKIANLSQLFFNCNKLTSIANDFLQKQDASGTATGAGKSTLTNVYCMFYGCSGIVGQAPNIWKTHSKISSYQGCFSNCAKMYNHPSNTAYNSYNTEYKIPETWIVSPW